MPKANDPQPMTAKIKKQLEDHQALFAALTVEPYLSQIEQLTEKIVTSYRQGGKLVLFGNGGSAADAQHVAAEMVARFKRNRPALPAIALTTNTSTLTAIGNDFAYKDVFSRQVEAMVNASDVAIGITTSGGSPNVVAGLKAAKARRAWTVAFTGKGGGPAGVEADLCLAMPSADTPRIQEAHIAILHIVCDLVEEALYAS